MAFEDGLVRDFGSSEADAAVEVGMCLHAVSCLAPAAFENAAALPGPSWVLAKEQDEVHFVDVVNMDCWVVSGASAEEHKMIAAAADSAIHLASRLLAEH